MELVRHWRLCGGNIWDKYEVVLLGRAFRDLDSIYSYVANSLSEPGVAQNLLNELEEGIHSLEQMPYRCPERKHGVYANRGYRQLFIESYTVIYRIDEEKKQVIVVTVRYSRSDF